MSKKKSICLNDQTVDNLINYLKQFPKSAKVTIWHNYKEFDCQIACNFRHQIENDKVQLLLGSFIEKS